MDALLQPADKTLMVNGLALRYREWGKADAPPVVCVHGYTGSADAFNALARRLGDRFRILAPDVRGHGESAWATDGAYGYLDQMSDIAALADRLEIEKFVLIGTSMGGVIAMAYAGAHPERLTALVLNDIGPDIEPGSTRITGMVTSRPDSFATLGEAKAYRAANSPILAARPAADQHELALGVLREGRDGRWVWKMDPLYIEQRAARVASSAPVRAALWPVLRALPCPTLVVWGAQSDVLSEAQARHMIEALPRGELVTVPGVGHAPTLVEPSVLAALDRFLGTL